MSQMTEQQKWEALLRGQVLSATTIKLNGLIRMVDQKAQIMVLLNSALIPYCMGIYSQGLYQVACAASITASLSSILAAIICIYPKRKYRKNGDRDFNLLHFNDVGHLDREEYLNLFMPEFNDPSKLAKLVVNDIYDTSRFSIIPKFVWLKISYGVFFFGNLAALLCTLIKF